MATASEQISRTNGGAEAAAARAGSQLHKFFDDVEELLRRVTRIDDADISRIRNRIESSLEAARASSERGVRKAIEGGKAAATATDEFVHRRPWTAIGVTAVTALAIGSLLRRR